MSNYSRGANFERRVKKYLENGGYLVIRSAGSHSPVDLVALRAGEVLLIQVKLNGEIPQVEAEQLIEIARENQCQALLAWNWKGTIIFKALDKEVQ